MKLKLLAAVALSLLWLTQTQAMHIDTIDTITPDQVEAFVQRDQKVQEIQNRAQGAFRAARMFKGTNPARYNQLHSLYLHFMEQYTDLKSEHVNSILQSKDFPENMAKQEADEQFGAELDALYKKLENFYPTTPEQEQEYAAISDRHNSLLEQYQALQRRRAAEIRQAREIARKFKKHSRRPSTN